MEYEFDKYSYRMLETIARLAKEKHDVGANQKYAGIHPYSFHLDMVASMVERFRPLLPNPNAESYEVAYASAYCHDLIEDARCSYNDVKEMTNELGTKVADVAFLLTEYRGRNRAERHPAQYYA